MTKQVDVFLAQHRKLVLQLLADDNHNDKGGDYNDDYIEFAATYGLTYDGEDYADEHSLPISQFAIITCDETYSMIQCEDTLTAALANLSDRLGDDTLGTNGSIVDLDATTLSGPGGSLGIKQLGIVKYRTVVLSEAAYLTLCGIVQPDYATCEASVEPVAVNHQGVFSESWDELRAAFPLEQFREHVPVLNEDNEGDEIEQAPIYYQHEAGM